MAKAARKFKFQEGGAAPAAPAAPAPAEQEQAMQQLQQMAMEIVQSLGPEGAMALAQVIMQIVQGAPQGPVYQKQGGKITGRLK